MAMFDFLRRDLTETWPLQYRQMLRLDLREFSLQGLVIGSPWEKLIKFGRPDSRHVRPEGTFRFHDLGIEVEVDQGRVDYFAVHLQKDPPMAAADIKLVGKDGAINVLSSDCAPDMIALSLGQPNRTDADDDETILFYNVDGFEVELECTPDGRLKRINWFPTDRE